MPDSSLGGMISDADMILIGVGEEFDDIRSLKTIDGCLELRNAIIISDEPWLLPKFDAVYREKTKSKVNTALDILIKLLEEKNYFVVSTSMNPDVFQANWKEGRFVGPCGSCLSKQCIDGCTAELREVTDSDDRILNECVENIRDKKLWADIGSCTECGKKMILNNVYAAKYNEMGYLNQWNLYTKWLQGTLNKKLLILELGVGVDYPSIIRFPFEKVAFYNNKASFYRVNGTLYQLPPELSEKGNSVAQNSIDWLVSMC